MTALGFAIGALLSAVALWVMRGASAFVLAMSGLFLFGAILAIYVGAYLTSPEPSFGLIAIALSTVIFGASGLALKYWPANIGVFILAHGFFDHFFGLPSGLPEWYPPFCFGVDVVAGLGLIWLLKDKRI